MKDENSLQKEIAVRLNIFIKSKNWNKKQFAEAMGIHAQNVSKYLSGDLDISNLFYRLHRFGCDVNWLISGMYPLECNKNYYLDEHATISDSLESYYSGYVEDILCRLKTVREAVYFPKDNFGEIDHVTEDYIKSVEDGHTKLSFGYLYFAIKTFNTNSIWLLTGAGDTYHSEGKAVDSLRRADRLITEHADLLLKYNSLEAKFEYANSLVKDALRCEESKSESKKYSNDVDADVRIR